MIPHGVALTTGAVVHIAYWRDGWEPMCGHVSVIRYSGEDECWREHTWRGPGRRAELVWLDGRGESGRPVCRLCWTRYLDSDARLHDYRAAVGQT